MAIMQQGLSEKSLSKHSSILSTIMVSLRMMISIIAPLILGITIFYYLYTQMHIMVNTDSIRAVFSHSPIPIIMLISLQAIVYSIIMEGIDCATKNKHSIYNNKSSRFYYVLTSALLGLLAGSTYDILFNQLGLFTVIGAIATLITGIFLLYIRLIVDAVIKSPKFNRAAQHATIRKRLLGKGQVYGGT